MQLQLIAEPLDPQREFGNAPREYLNGPATFFGAGWIEHRDGNVAARMAEVYVNSIAEHMRHGYASGLQVRVNSSLLHGGDQLCGQSARTIRVPARHVRTDAVDNPQTRQKICQQFSVAERIAVPVPIDDRICYVLGVPIPF